MHVGSAERAQTVGAISLNKADFVKFCYILSLFSEFVKKKPNQSRASGPSSPSARLNWGLERVPPTVGVLG